MGPESVLSTQTGIRPVTVSLPSQTTPNLLKNPHLSPLEKRLGVILLNSKTVKASFNAFFFNGDQIISVNRKNLQSMTAQDLNRSDLEVTLIPGLKHVDRHSIVKLEQISSQHNSLSDGQKNIINSNFHVFSENKRIVSVENCKTAKPKDHLIRGLYTLTTTAEKMLKNDKNIEFLCDYVTEQEPDVLEENSAETAEQLQVPDITKTKIVAKKDTSRKNIVLLTPDTIDSIPIRLINESISNELKSILSTHVILNLSNSDFIMPNGYLFTNGGSVVLHSGGSDGVSRIQDMYQAYQRMVSVEQISIKPRNCVSTSILPEGPYIAVYKNSSCLLTYYNNDVSSNHKLILIKKQVQCLNRLSDISESYEFLQPYNIPSLNNNAKFAGDIGSPTGLNPVDFVVYKTLNNSISEYSTFCKNSSNSGVCSSLINEMECLKDWIGNNEVTDGDFVTDFVGDFSHSRQHYVIGCWSNYGVKVILIYEMSSGPPLPENWRQVAKQTALYCSYVDPI